MSTSSNGTGLRRSTRNQRNVPQRYNNNNHNGHSSQYNNSNGHSNNSSNNNNRISGRKRAQPDQSSDESSDDSTDDESDDSDYETSHSLSTSIANNNHNNNRRSRRNNNHQSQSQLSQTQLTQLQTQSSASQMTDAERQRAKKRKIQYQVTTEKWKQNQSNIQRRSTRLRYRKLADDTHDNRAAIVDPMSNQFMDKLEEQNKIYEDVCHPNEAFMDIEQAKNMTNILKEQTRTLANEQFTITPNDYVSALNREFGINNQNAQNGSQHHNDDDDTKIEVNWMAIGQKFAPWFLTVPAIQFMNGPLQQCEQVPEVQKKPRQVRQKKTFTTDAPVVQPKKVVKQKKADKTETKSRVTHLKKTLRKKCEDQDGVNPFEFLINPESYSQTIENLFDMSFIMKEGFAQMDVNETTEQPVLSYVSSAERTRRHTLNNNPHTRQQAKTNGQCIVKFNPSTFCNLINIYNISQSQIQRADANISSDEEQSDQDQSESDDESEEEQRTNKRRGGLGQSRKRGRGRGRGRVNGHSNGYSNGRGRGRVIRNGRRRNNDKEEAD